MESGLDGKFAADGLCIGIDTADGGGVQGALAGLVAGHQDAQTSHDTTHVLVIAGACGDEGAAERRPLVPVIQGNPWATGCARERRVQVQGIRIELRELGVLRKRGQGPEETQC